MEETLLEGCKKKPQTAILGGGPSGLAAAYFCRLRNIPFCLYEAEASPGGMAVTYRHGEFLFDSGAHRFHNCFPEITEEIKKLMGSNLMEIHIPSQIYSHGKMIDFPLSPMNIMSRIGILSFLKSAYDFVRSRMRRPMNFNDFQTFAMGTYGQTIASRFLLSYSQKLWGTPCTLLSPEIAGKRMQGLDLKTFFLEAFAGSKPKTRHLDGEFFYPRRDGIGAIFKEMESAVGPENIRPDSRISRVLHNGSLITEIDFQDGRRVKPEKVISSLPLPDFLTMMDPALPASILGAAADLSYRSMVLVALFLEKEKISSNASIYFPDAEFPFTRIYEPKNRSDTMAPPGKTSLVMEVPCDFDDRIWNLPSESLVQECAAPLIQIGWIRNDEIIDSAVHRIRHAYPILLNSACDSRQTALDYLNRFSNLRLTGRQALFKYTHIHDQIKDSREAVDSFHRKDPSGPVK